MIDLSRPVNLSSAAFVNNKFEWYERIREERPVHQAKVSVMTVYIVSRYDDCVDILKDPRVLRNRTTVTGGSRMAIPMPKSLKPMIERMSTDLPVPEPPTTPRISPRLTFRSRPS